MEPTVPQRRWHPLEEYLFACKVAQAMNQVQNDLEGKESKYWVECIVHHEEDEQPTGLTVTPDEFNEYTIREE